MAKTEAEFHRPEGEWQPAFPGIHGFWQQILSHDMETGDYTRLLRIEPGGDATSTGSLVHDFWEEVFVVEGEITDIRLDETFTAGMYACRPPGMVHGPFMSEKGCLLFEIRYGAPGK